MMHFQSATPGQRVVELVQVTAASVGRVRLQHDGDTLVVMVVVMVVMMVVVVVVVMLVVAGQSVPPSDSECGTDSDVTEASSLMP